MDLLDIKKNISELKIDYTISVKEYDQSLPIDKRSAVRGIVLQGRKILVVHTERDGLYGTPGGGIEDGETLLETLKRELYEEVGALSLSNIEYLGKIIETRPGMNKDAIFNPTMNYFYAEVTEFGEQHLIEYEKELNLQCSFVDIDEAIETNDRILSNGEFDYQWFYMFQTEIFKIIKSLFDL